MKKYYYAPDLKIKLIDVVDVLTYSAGTLQEGEFENEEQWWKS